MKIPSQALVLALAFALTGAGCAKLQARQAFKDGNKAYTEENYKKAIESYETAVKNAPDMAEAYFYLGSSHQALYRPGRETDENRQHIELAVENFKRSLEVNKLASESQKSVHFNTLAALTGIYAEDPYKNYDEAYKYAEQLVQANPSDPKNLFAMANLYERFGKTDEAEKMYVRATEVNPNDVKACSALAGFYNKPLWDGRSRFDQAIQVLERCASLAPEDPAGWYKVAVFYWDKAYRDPLISDKQKDEYADKGLVNVGKALELNPAYVDAIVYKGLLLRVKALGTSNPRLRAQYLDQAQTLAKQARDLRLQQQREAEAAARTLGTAPAGN
jgi:tetratricopeptide (TPR) repeat protein